VEAGIGEKCWGVVVFTAENAKDAEKKENRISGIILDAAIAVHTALGPGLLESAYQACLTYELTSRGLRVQTQVPLPIKYRGVCVDAAYRIDLIVEDLVVIEIKAVERLLPIHEAQLLSYLKLSDKRLGLLVNFHVLRLKDGYKRIVNGL
jgi:GxxExxY protein